MHRIGFVLALASLSLAAHAQTLGPDQARLRWVDRLAALRGAAVSVRWDEETGSFARLRFEGGRPLLAPGSAGVARWIEAELAPLLEDGLRVAGEDEPLPGGAGLMFVGSQQLGPGRARFDFDQVVGGLPVLAARVQVELQDSPAGPVPVLVFARYLPGVPADLGALVAPQVTAGLAARFPGYESAELSAPTQSRLVVVQDEETRAPRPAWAVEHLRDPQNAVTTYVDAATGQALFEESRTCAATAQGQAYEKNPGQTPRAAQALAGLYVTQGNNRVTTDANGAHPLTGMVSLTGMSGPIVRVFVSNEDELVYNGPADIALVPAETAAAQDEVAAFQHVMRFNYYLRATYPPFAQSQAVNTRFALIARYKQNGQPVQNAFFTPQGAQAGGESFPAGYIGMGTFGGREAARSSNVVQHEYTHALLSRIVDLNGNVQAGGLNEGLADYFTCARDDDPRVGVWLANPIIRDLDRNFRWPDDNNGDVHRVGNIFAGALWDARTAAGAVTPGDRLLVDQAVAAGVFRLPPRSSLLAAREAIVEADRTVNQGRFRRVLEDAFAAHGIGPASANRAPALTSPGDQTVAAGATLTLTLAATDPDGDALTLTVSPLPNSTVDGRARRFAFTPDAGQVGDHSVTFTVTDGGDSDSQTVRITVTPGAAGAPGAGTLPGSVGPVGSTASAATAAGAPAPRGGGGGGGGCVLGTDQDQGLPALSLLLLLLAGLVLRLRAVRLALVPAAR